MNNLSSQSKLNSWEDLFRSGIFGAARNVATQFVVYPFDAIRTRQQLDNLPIDSAVRQIVNTKGFFGLYSGLKEQLLRGGINGTWRWPLVTEMPVMLESSGFSPLSQHLLTAFTVASIEAFTTAPIERRRILVIDQRQAEFTLKSAYIGSIPSFMRLTTAWSSFLIAQKYFRDDYKNKSGRDFLTSSEIGLSAVKVATVVTVMQAPFDVYKTLSQSKSEQKTSEEIRKKLFSGSPKIIFVRLMRGSTMSLTASVIQNFFSLHFLQHLDR